MIQIFAVKKRQDHAETMSVINVTRIWQNYGENIVKRRSVWHRQDSAQLGSRGISACGLGRVWQARPWRRNIYYCETGQCCQFANMGIGNLNYDHSYFWSPGYNMTTCETHWRVGIRDLLLQYGAGEHTVVSALPTKIDLDRQLLLLRVPHSWNLALLHCLLDLEQSRKSNTASIHSNGKGRFNWESKKGTSITKEEITNVSPMRRVKQMTIRRISQAWPSIHHSTHQTLHLSLLPFHKCWEVLPGVGYRSQLAASSQELNKLELVQPELKRALLENTSLAELEGCAAQVERFSVSSRPLQGRFKISVFDCI